MSLVAIRYTKEKVTIYYGSLRSETTSMYPGLSSLGHHFTEDTSLGYWLAGTKKYYLYDITKVEHESHN